MNSKNNRRAKMTKLLFHNALLELMQEKPFSKITIKEICEQADLNRTTFYLHYADQNELLKEIERDTCQKTHEYIKKLDTASDISELITALLKYIKQNHIIFNTLFSSGETDWFQVELVQNVLIKVYDKFPDFRNTAYKNYIIGSLMHGTCHMIIEWINNRFDLKESELAALIIAFSSSAENVRDNVEKPLYKTRDRSGS